MRTKVGEGELGLKQAWRYYRDKHQSTIDYKTYKQVVEEYLKEVSKLILDEAYEFHTPFGLGTIRIRKSKMSYKRLKIDWGETKKQGFTCYHLNQHSDGYKGKIHWEKKNIVMTEGTKRPYSFVPCRDMKRALASIFKQVDGHSKYPEEVIVIKTKQKDEISTI